MWEIRPTAWLCAVAVIAASLSSCGKKQKDEDDDDEEVLVAPVSSGHVRAPGTSGRFNVGIIDDGFDLNQPLFDGRVLADYEIVCVDPSESSAAAVDQDVKDYFIGAYAKTDDSCSLQPGITFEYSNDLKNLERRRDFWNTGIMAKSINLDTTDAIEFRTVLGGYDRSVLYHGTNTSSLILYGNPDVRLVVFRMNLNGGSGMHLQAAECPGQEEIDLWVEANQDPAVAAAYAATPVSSYDLAFEDVVATYGINLFNASFGRVPREIQEQLLVNEGCPALDLKPFYATQVALDQKRFAARRSSLPLTSAALTVQASGNDGVVVDGGGDSLDCVPGTNNVLVGSHDIGGKRSLFSNYGACVPYATLGEQVVVGAPRQFLDVADGTSFAAPLAVRYLSLVSESGDSATVMLAKLQAKVNGQGFLADDTFPVELAYSNPTAIGEFRLTEEKPYVWKNDDPRWLKARGDLMRKLRPLGW